jgi:mannose-6-phosphate isomerase-like protein (cupin superfamily)
MSDEEGVTKEMSNEVTSLKSFKHAPSIDISTWYKGILSTLLATDENTGGAFDFVLYVFDGKLEVYVGNNVFQVEPRKCVFLPLGRPHAFIIRSPKIRMLVLVTPGGLLKTLALMSAPAEKLEIPSDTVIYATVDLEETTKVFLKHGVRFFHQKKSQVRCQHFRYGWQRNCHPD